jgi:glycosyltransferase involved in cell wall biosynthesis
VTVLNFWSPTVAAILEQTLRGSPFDTVQMEGVHLVRYLPVIRAAAPSAAVLADWHNIESEILWRYADTGVNAARRLYARRTGRLLERAEMTLLKNCDEHTVTSDRERDKLRQRCPGAVLHTIPNRVDVSFYAGLSAPAQDPPRREILFVGSMDYSANIDAVQWLVREVWPVVKRQNPDLRLTIVGRKPSPSVQALAAGDIEVTGTVEDVRTFYRRALAVVAPLRIGSGTRLKILEAMAAGVPVVSTRVGAEGLNVSDGLDIILGDTGEEIAQALLRIVSIPGLRERQAQAARDLVARSYDWGGLGTALYGIHESARESRRRSLDHVLTY